MAKPVCLVFESTTKINIFWVLEMGGGIKTATSQSRNRYQQGRMGKIALRIFQRTLVDVVFC
jgi:hypothetical protein